ncbi:hypothetical protein AAFF_G00106260 [Aldrovandia affinis]|uniref:Uncharacterized protein n=1 Tax=Aldrovandia affinis TaxID=143900 RepID=A0AAD7T256_9TELE|nr:hypothetical protein AAFF_G00106260 [Aldrovandia affinis]
MKKTKVINSEFMCEWDGDDRRDSTLLKILRSVEEWQKSWRRSVWKASSSSSDDFFPTSGLGFESHWRAVVGVGGIMAVLVPAGFNLPSPQCWEEKRPSSVHSPQSQEYRPKLPLSAIVSPGLPKINLEAFEVHGMETPSTKQAASCGQRLQDPQRTPLSPTDHLTQRR